MTTILQKTGLALGLITGLAVAAPAVAEPVDYAFDASHSQLIFHYNHFGYSTTWGMYSGFDGSIVYDAEAPADSSVEVSFPVDSMITGWDERLAHFMSPDFFGGEDKDKTVTFKSTSIEVTGDNTALITGDLTLNGITKPVVLDTTLTNDQPNPMTNAPALGFFATTTLLRSDFGVDLYAPMVSDEVQVEISLEAAAAAE
ncbi:YceI family protein [Pseudooceanicola sp. 502str34]